LGTHANDVNKSPLKDFGEGGGPREKKKEDFSQPPGSIALQGSISQTKRRMREILYVHPKQRNEREHQLEPLSWASGGWDLETEHSSSFEKRSGDVRGDTK